MGQFFVSVDWRSDMSRPTRNQLSHHLRYRNRYEGLPNLDKDPRKEARRVFRSYGAIVTGRVREGTIYTFPDGATVVIHNSDGHHHVGEKIRTVKARYGHIRPTELAGLAKVGNAPKLDLERLHASEHAKERLALMQSQARVTFSDVLHAIRLPERVMYSERHSAWLWIRHPLAVAVCEVHDGHLIKSILWSDNELFDQYPRPKE